MSDSPRKTDLLNDTVVGDFANSTDLWDTIENTLKGWREACCDEEGKDLLAFLQGKQLDRFLSMPPNRTHGRYGGSEVSYGGMKPMAYKTVFDHIDDAVTMEDLVGKMSIALARKTQQLKEIHALSRPHFKEDSA